MATNWKSLMSTKWYVFAGKLYNILCPRSGKKDSTIFHVLKVCKSLLENSTSLLSITVFIIVNYFT